MSSFVPSLLTIVVVGAGDVPVMLAITPIMGTLPSLPVNVTEVVTSDAAQRAVPAGVTVTSEMSARASSAVSKFAPVASNATSVVVSPS